MVAPGADPMSGAVNLPFILGALAAVVGWLLLVIAAFKEKVWWGLLVLVGPFAVDAIAGRNAWVSTIGGLIIVLPFVLPRFSQRKIAICFALMAIGSLTAVQGTILMYAAADAQEKARITSAEKPAPPPTAVPTYTPAPVEAAPVPVKPRPKPAVTSTAQPEISTPEIIQVYVFNATKTFYPLDCGKQPEGSYKMSKSMAVRQGYKLAKECSP